MKAARLRASVERILVGYDVEVSEAKLREDCVDYELSDSREIAPRVRRL